MTQLATYHVPVLLRESVDALLPGAAAAGGCYVDATFGGGGHSREILARLTAQGHLYGFDQDADAEHNIPQGESRFTFVRSNFRYLANWLRYYEVSALDGVLADLGVSSHHFDDETRGFSFRFDAPLDMRMNAREGLNGYHARTAADIVMTYSEEQLATLFHLYGELKNARRLAAALVKARTLAPIDTVGRLLDTVRPLMPREREKKDLARVFQALRIEVNGEMEALHELLDSAIRALRPGGRLVVLTYHSLEDRMVKNYMRAGNAEGKTETDFYGNRLAPLRPIGKALAPDADEQARNPRSRSARLRVAEKI